MKTANTDPANLALAAAGSLAGGVAAELRVPLRELREGLAVIVEILDQHLNEHEGPAPYPWTETKALRERVAQAYLTGRKVARLNSDLGDAINSYGKNAELVDVNKLVEVATNLTRHRISAGTELFIDFGKVSDALVVPGEVVLLLARLLTIAADSANGVPGAAISVKTRQEEAASGYEIAIYVADSGSGLPGEVEEVSILGKDVAKNSHGTFEGTSELGAGSVFVLRIPVKQ
ncbi:MAG: HAMP domain-containing histidine kinase [Kofleriaceae bacterium]|nr:HAMP domain-containing histidine kinase [Kofleriaceae bacterium]